MLITRPLQDSRWAPLAAFVARWYREPLAWPRGPRLERVDAQIAQVEHRLGSKLPQGIREWFALAGHRLADVNQDRPVRLEGLEVEDGRLPVWWENQGNWSVDIELTGNEPRAVVVSDEPNWNRRATTTQALRGMVVSDTLAGADRGVGPLGALRPEVVGGYLEDPPPDLEARLEALPALDVFINPYFEAPMRGHEALVVRAHPGAGCDWMAATPEALAQARALLSLQQ